MRDDTEDIKNKNILELENKKGTTSWSEAEKL